MMRPLPVPRRKDEMRPITRVPLLAALAMGILAFATACGGSDGPDSVSGCKIESGTS